MDLDDSFTERLAQRRKARKELISNIKTEGVSVGKKRAALIDEQQINTDIPPEESPKRQCTQAPQTTYSPDNKENFQVQNEIPDVAFVPLQTASKARGLAALKKNFVNGDEDFKTEEPQVNKCSTYVFSTNSSDLCTGQKSRFANLAANIRQWEDDSCGPTLSSNNVTNKSTDSTDSGLHGDSGSSMSSASVSAHVNGDLVKVSALKKGNIDVGCGPSIHGRLQAWDEAVKATLNTAVSKQHPIKSPIKSSENYRKDSEYIKESCSAAADECINEKDFAENYDEIGSEQDNEVKMEVDCSPIKSLKSERNFNVQAKPITDKTSVAVVQGCINTKNVDPAELPLSARKALFEKALLGGTPKLNQDVVDPKLSVAQRAAMFENATKSYSGPKKASGFKEPKRIAVSQFSKFDNVGSSESNSTVAIQSTSIKSPVKSAPAFARNSPVKAIPEFSASSPVKGFQHAKTNIQDIRDSPTKKVISPSATSTPSPSKNVGSHTRFIQQKLIENSGSNLQGKEIAARAAEERKQELSSLVNHWEKLSSSSSVENNSEMEKNDQTSQEQFSCESDAVPETSLYDESNSDDQNEDEYVEEEEEEEQENEQKADSECCDEESDVEECVFDSQDAEIESLKSLGSNCSNEPNMWSKEDALSLSSQPRSIISSQSCSVSSYSDDSNYNVSKSQSCTSGSSARSCDVTDSNVVEDAPSSSRENKNPDVPLLYTVSFYRKQKQETKLTPVRTIVRREKVNSPESTDTDYTQVIQARIKSLQEEILRQQTVISQTSQALNLCSATAEFSGSTEQVEGERLLLIATQKRQVCLNEIQRLKTYGAQGENVSDGKGTLTLSDIQLPLKREFMASQLEGKGTDTVHYFLCLIRHGAQVMVTQMMSTSDKVSDGALCFTNHIKLQNLPADFSVVFEVYALQAKKEILPHEKKYHIKREHSKIRLTPKSKKLDGKLPAISSPGGPNAVRSPSFGVVGFTRFTLQNCNKKTFTLDKVPYASPLEGILRIKLQLHAEHKVMEKGFLTMFEDVSGFGAWHRRWCALDAHQLAYWKYPDDEHKKQPINIIDLKQCVTGEVKSVSRDVCARPHTFQLVTVRPQAKGDKNSLISRSYNTLTTTKYLLSADTKEERILWCNKLNEALTNVRKWDPQALRPVEALQN